ncbi:MAG: efflux RND transporter periplasmic adaptor subunit [Blastocatellia bacterium]|nr:efflux RND transporter periplasmic adaptor subunit [Blastocatellia bacterium]
MFVAAVTILALAAVVWTVIRPQPLEVETVAAKRGALQVTVDAEGKTRFHDRFVLAAPVGGRLSRIALHRGDPVAKDMVVARIDPVPPALLDPRQQAETQARMAAAQAAKREAEVMAEHAHAAAEQAKRELVRAEKLAATGDISRQDLERRQMTATTMAKELEAAQFKVREAMATVAEVKATLQTPSQTGGNPPVVEIRAPVAGSVLRVIEESERVVTAGTPLIEVSNPGELEIVIDVLSTDAVKVLPGAAVSIEGWGGETPLAAQVRLVEPAAFTKISALGVEEQRVNVVADFRDQPQRLGDGFRVDARIVIWEHSQVLKIPTNALFRQGTEWTVFVVEKGRARCRLVRIGHQNAQETEITGGIENGTPVIVHPSNQVLDGKAVKTIAAG